VTGGGGPRIRVLLADDHPVVRQGLRTFLELQDDVEIVGEAGDGAEAVAVAARALPDVVLLDLVMPGMDGVDAIRGVRSASPGTRVVVLTTFSDDRKVVDSIKAGAAGYLLKDVRPPDLAEAVRAVHRGESVLHPRVGGKLMREVARPPRACAVESLSERELDVLRLLATGLPNREIAARLVLSEKTIKTHVSSILAKLEVSDRTQAALYAVREGLVD
jgi:NarL family two-component system response regulator LiaR